MGFGRSRTYYEVRFVFTDVSPKRAELWFRVISVILALEQVALAYFGWWLTTYVPPADMIEYQDTLTGGGRLLMVMGTIFIWPNLALAVAPRKPWVWVAGLTNLAAAVVCCPPGALLLFAWNRADVKRHYGMPE